MKRWLGARCLPRRVAKRVSKLMVARSKTALKWKSRKLCDLIHVVHIHVGIDGPVEVSAPNFQIRAEMNGLAPQGA